MLAELIVRGPERIALVGPNGAGKTTLLRAIAGLAGRPGVDVRLGAVVGYLPQRLDILDDSLSVVDNVRAAAPAASVNEVRASLARFLFRGERADRLAGTLSGGERFRAVLAALLLAQPAPQLLLLDEPTNNLDMASVRQLSAGARGLPRRDPGGQPRRAVPAFGRDHPLAPPGPRSRPDRDRPAYVIAILRPLTRVGLRALAGARGVR